jgi:hypothetical protein
MTERGCFVVRVFKQRGCWAAARSGSLSSTNSGAFLATRLSMVSFGRTPAVDFFVNLMAAIENEKLLPLMVEKSQMLSQTGFSKAGAGISKTFDISVTGVGQPV